MKTQTEGATVMSANKIPIVFVRFYYQNLLLQLHSLCLQVNPLAHIA